ncbi:hypothetical protein N9263_01340 [Candidatus Marinimicrobia bacterium]|nr:hypothetical protein [Candidatus Neomarinimicrobiota bacterium]
MNKLILFILFIFIQGCGSSENSNAENFKLPNDVRWVVKSSEYKILSNQVYENAWANLSNIFGLADSKSCIVMDLDETVLDNSKYQIDLVQKGESYNPESWSEWVNLEMAELVPGAKDFIDKLRQTNVKIIFLSNRMHKNLNPTLSNMKKLDIVSSDDIFLLRLDKKDKKNIRRNEIIHGIDRLSKIGPLKILAYFGDAKHDFPDVDDYYAFGKNMYMFPNPMYGKW